MKLDEIEAYLKDAELPEYIQITDAEKVTDVRLFIDNHIAMLRANSGNRTYLPYYNRLLALTKILQHDNRSTTV
jgi:hypothetical protein